MNIHRRRTLASAAQALLPELEAAVVASWPELLPTATSWTPAQGERARTATRAALAGLADVLAQGDLDDLSWQRLRGEVAGHGRATPDEVGELLRAVRVVGVQLLADRLRETVGLSVEERWTLQAHAGWLLDQLADARTELDPGDSDDLLAELHRDGPDAGGI
jgi:hypothetical protein